ncbi:hypothetical protein KM043_008285 [Ampulex compressa]|nr:hypothetical protein KM043_008285 [Ampulex compressa]
MHSVALAARCADVTFRNELTSRRSPSDGFSWWFFPARQRQNTAGLKNDPNTDKGWVCRDESAAEYRIQILDRIPGTLYSSPGCCLWIPWPDNVYHRSCSLEVALKGERRGQCWG